MEVALYIYDGEIAKRIELFQDEKISITSSIQNVNDISKVFTDYSQSFTIPASDTNNQIFKHWYENSLDNGYDVRLRYAGYIEIDTQVFRTGKWQLESASIKNNRVEDYKLTFYGNLVSLSDKFKDDKLKDLETLNDYTINYTGSNVRNTITTTDDTNVSFPLISSKRVWQYGVGGADDISLISGRIGYEELFPAVKIKTIFDAIQSKYGVTFNGNFLTQSRFQQAYMWFKNKETFVRLSSPSRLDFLVTSPILNDYVDFDVTDNNYSIFYDVPVLRKLMTINGTLSVSCNWQVSVYKSNILFTSFSGNGTSIVLGLPRTNGDYYITIQTGLPCTFTGTVSGSYQQYVDTGSGYALQNFETASTFIATTSGELDLTQYAPDIKVSDFFSGILKMFNLTAFSFDEENYTLEQLENWYYQGQIKDFSEYCFTDFDFERIKPYKKVNFSYEKSESVLNRNFNDTNQREYGNLDYTFNSDGSDYAIKLPFENLLFNKFTGINLQVGYALNRDLKPYIPKPIILYKLGNVPSGGFTFNNGTSTSTITDYNVFGQDVYYQNNINSLNWGEEISSYFLDTVNNSLFINYYFDYLNNLYSLKSRMVKVSMRLPYSELLGLRLNDRIVIRDKRYIINSFTTDLDTFESKMELIQDFRSLTFNNSVGRDTDNTAKVLNFDTVSNVPLTWSILDDPTAAIISVTDGVDYVEVSIKANTTGLVKNYSIISSNNDIIVITQDA